MGEDTRFEVALLNLAQKDPETPTMKPEEWVGVSKAQPERTMGKRGVWWGGDKKTEALKTDRLDF